MRPSLELSAHLLLADCPVGMFQKHIPDWCQAEHSSLTLRAHEAGIKIGSQLLRIVI